MLWNIEYLEWFEHTVSTQWFQILLLLLTVTQHVRQSEICPNFNFLLLAHMKHLFTTTTKLLVLWTYPANSFLWICNLIMFCLHTSLALHLFESYSFFMDQFESHLHKSLAISDGTLNRYDDICLEITIYSGVWNKEDLYQTQKDSLNPPCSGLPHTHTAQSRNWAISVLGLVAHNLAKDTPKKFTFRSYKTKEQRIKEACCNPLLSCIRREKIA